MQIEESAQARAPMRMHIELRRLASLCVATDESVSSRGDSPGGISAARKDYTGGFCPENRMDERSAQ
jgi:hypothetical protein